MGAAPRATLAARRGGAGASDGDDGRLDYHLECVAVGPEQVLAVRMRTASGTTETTYRRDCPAAGPTIAQGGGGFLDRLAVGSTVELSLVLQEPDGRTVTGVAGQSALYMVGTDGQLRAGAGSVWR